MTTKMIITGDDPDKNNWMDLKDLFIKMLNDVDSELKLTKFITGIVLSVCPTPEDLVRTRENIGLKTTKEGVKELKKLYAEELKKDDNN